jgi:hypothetical protein
MKRLLPCVLLLTLAVVAQQPSAAPVAAVAQASVLFSFDWTQGIPWQKYTIEVPLDGKSHFDGTPHPDETSDTDPVQKDFVMSEANRLKVFELAQKLNYFRGDFDSHLKHIAQTGEKTLQYRSPQVNGSATYNWSQNADIEELTRFFQGVALTIDYGRLLVFQYRFDKLGMDKRLKELEDLQASHDVEELGIIAPILKKIAADPNLMNISRESAKRLLATTSQPGVAAQNPTAQ